jgi:transposase
VVKLGHDPRMMPPAYIKPYVRRQKNDAADAAGICEAVTRPSMRFVGVRMRRGARRRPVARRMAANFLVTRRTSAVVCDGTGDTRTPRCDSRWR